MPAGTSALMSSMAHPGSMALPMDSAALLATPCPDMVGASRLSSSSYSFSDHITSCAVTFRLAPAEPRKPPDSSARRAQARRRLREEAKAQWKATQAWEKGQETKWGDAQGEQEKGWGQQEAREKRQEKRLQQQRSTTACDESSDLMKMFEDAKSAGAVVQVGPCDSGPPEPVDVEEVAMPQAVQVGDASDSESAWNEERESACFSLACHKVKESGGTVLAAVRWAASAQWWCHLTGRCLPAKGPRNIILDTRTSDSGYLRQVN
jgi:hypothetical protein